MNNNRDYSFEEIPDSFHNEQDFYAKFRERLDDVQKFPADYLFKFIYPSNEETMKKIKDVYAGTNAEYEYKASKNRKYTSISIKLYVIDSETVINYYKEIAKIEGVIML
ncbi:DUF493 domain-containing protein [Empedobacter stercoris]|uniref:DUF493 domain-containing protein n=2 Tax=Empedobacter TaxID=59734 RepID=A0ABY8VDM5_9FLAO|nr:MULTISPECIES: DUF493 family protein [Empedobacter]MCA4776560.1 DUF493 domain-containing protein [Empedobacter stercoris]MCA4808974.1 DUF493 domain-containing protein [Empedobacter stercoris]MDM1521940.1 DUF493 domain-containing protein [Empedobacter sp. 225-1]MDM1542209.1 DUF493 domain-containing protein [Empedobacter sp. 189-2]NOJ74788.1 DUF493 domain-containing protein [Empedobacter stercoris]